jgi:hypothetical protein
MFGQIISSKNNILKTYLAQLMMKIKRIALKNNEKIIRRDEIGSSCSII